MKAKVEVVQGTLELLILKTLSRGEAMHGFGVLAWLKDATDGELAVEEGALYPALHRMEQRELIGGEWGISEKGRRARYYRITSAGRAQLRQEERKWTRYMHAWQQIVAAAATA
jgi:transcriptional regulator